MLEMKNETEARNAKVIGALMILLSVLIVFTMAHHPFGAHGQGGLAQSIHGIMIALATALFGCMAWVFGRQKGQSLSVLFGLVAYGVSLASHIGAAIMNGFIVPALARLDTGEVGHDIFLLCWEINQALAGLGVFATGLAYIFWGYALLKFEGRGNRSVGGLGVVAGLVPMVLLGFDLVNMNVSGALFVYGLHMVWPIVLGIFVFRRRII